MKENKVGFASQCHPEFNSGSRCLNNQKGEMPNQVWHDTSFGFTLIELLVVVLIIGILAAIALPQYNKAIERSRMAEAMQRLGDYASAQQVYYMHNNGFASAYSTLNQGDIKVPEQTTVGNWDTGDSRWNVFRATGSSLERVTMSAQRMSGIYKDCLLTLSVEANGKIEKSCSGNDACCKVAQASGYSYTSDYSGGNSSGSIDPGFSGGNSSGVSAYWSDWSSAYQDGFNIDTDKLFELASGDEIRRQSYNSAYCFGNVDDNFNYWATTIASEYSFYAGGMSGMTKTDDPNYSAFESGVIAALSSRYYDDFVDAYNNR